LNCSLRGKVMLKNLGIHWIENKIGFKADQNVVTNRK
jgi:hypothetical protein